MDEFTNIHIPGPYGCTDCGACMVWDDLRKDAPRWVCPACTVRSLAEKDAEIKCVRKLYTERLDQYAITRIQLRYAVTEARRWRWMAEEDSLYNDHSCPTCGWGIGRRDGRYECSKCGMTWRVEGPKL